MEDWWLRSWSNDFSDSDMTVETLRPVEYKQNYGVGFLVCQLDRLLDDKSVPKKSLLD